LGGYFNPHSRLTGTGFFYKGCASLMLFLSFHPSHFLQTCQVYFPMENSTQAVQKNKSFSF
jgi:hypothetical protein